MHLVYYSNTPDMIFLICIPTLAVSSVKLYLFPRVRVFVSVCCYRCHASHIMSSCALHLHTCSSHAFEHFPRCPFCIPALRSPPVVISSFLSCVGIKHFRIGPRLAKRPWFTTVDRLSSSVPFGLRLILQRLTEGPKRPRVCCSSTPLQVGPKPT